MLEKNYDNVCNKYNNFTDKLGSCASITNYAGIENKLSNSINITLES